MGWDMVIYILRHVTRAFSSHERFTEMINTTGPRNSGKSFVVMVLSKFLGDGHKNYVGSLDKDYFTRPPAKTGTSNADSGRNPALAQNRNKRLIVVPDSPDVFFRSDVMKPLVRRFRLLRTMHWKTTTEIFTLASCSGAFLTLK